MYGGYLIGQTASAAGLYYTMEGLSTGETSTIDLAVANVSVMAAPFPVIGSALEFGQLVWDLIDPIVPE